MLIKRQVQLKLEMVTKIGFQHIKLLPQKSLFATQIDRIIRKPTYPVRDLEFKPSESALKSVV